MASGLVAVTRNACGATTTGNTTKAFVRTEEEEQAKSSVHQPMQSTNRDVREDEVVVMMVVADASCARWLMLKYS